MKRQNLFSFIVTVLVSTIPGLCISIQSKSQNKLKIRLIKSQPNNITHALDILAENPSSDNDPTVVVEAIRVCGNSNRADLAISTYRKYPSEPARTTTISVLGAQDMHLEAYELIQQDEKNNYSTKFPITSASYNAAIAACAKKKDWELALKIHNEIPKCDRTTLGTNALLTILAKCKRGKEALEVLDRFDEKEDGRVPSRITYQIMIHVLVRSNMVKEAHEILKKLTLQNQGDNKNETVEPTDAMFDMIIAAYNRKSDWKSIRQVELLRHPNRKIGVDDIQNKYAFQHWDKLERVGKGKGSYFIVGHIILPPSSLEKSPPLNITIGVRPHRNPNKNGIQLEFWETNLERSTKLGFLLMMNDAEMNTSSLLGMFLSKSDRGRGISRICLATWLWFCLKASIIPVTGVINKPLLALALQYRFGFVPQKGGIDIELAKENGNDEQKGKLVIYSPSHKSIEGAFSPWDIANQDMLVLKQPPNPRGRMISVRTKFHPPKDTQELDENVKFVLPEGSVKCHLTIQDIQRLYFGKEL